MKLFAAAVLTIFSAGAAWAAEDCKAIAEPMARLTCFDKINSTPKGQPKQARVDPDIVKAKNAVSRSLKDPESAKFENLYKTTDGLMPIVCGEVNSRNGYGGYAGRTPFVYVASSDHAYLIDMNSPDPAEVLEGLPIFQHSCKGMPGR